MRSINHRRPLGTRSVVLVPPLAVSCRLGRLPRHGARGREGPVGLWFGGLGSFEQVGRRGGDTRIKVAWFAGEALEVERGRFELVCPLGRWDEGFKGARGAQMGDAVTSRSVTAC
jgi:hypothetical protein